MRTPALAIALLAAGASGAAGCAVAPAVVRCNADDDCPVGFDWDCDGHVEPTLGPVDVVETCSATPPCAVTSSSPRTLSCGEMATYASRCERQGESQCVAATTTRTQTCR